jgi:hypothetical protein
VIAKLADAPAIRSRLFSSNPDGCISISEPRAFDRNPEHLTRFRTTTMGRTDCGCAVARRSGYHSEGGMPAGVRLDAETRMALSTLLINQVSGRALLPT